MQRRARWLWQNVEMHLDVDFVRSQFPAFQADSLRGWSFFENAGGSYACVDTIEALTKYYTETKLQPYAPYPASTTAGEQLDQAHVRWAAALGVESEEMNFGPSTSANTYVLANALGDMLSASDEVVVTNQDHEANTGSIRRAAERAGATIREWRIDPDSGLLDLDQLASMLSNRTKLVVFPHCSNIIGQENDVARICEMVHQVGGWTIVDGVSFVPHTIPDVGALGADVYLFSLYKVYSVHQGVMVLRRGLMDALPNQGHYFNDNSPWYRMTPAGPDHAQVAASTAVLDYIQRLDGHHYGAVANGNETDLAASCRRVSKLWADHEDRLLGPVLDFLDRHPGVRLLGPADLKSGHEGAHRCPTVAFDVANPAAVAAALIERKIMTSSGDYYAVRVLEGMGINPDPGVVRVSWVHYTSEADIQALLAALAEVLPESRVS